jgi:hypothetical protein
MLDTTTTNIGEKQIDPKLTGEQIRLLSIYELANVMRSCGYTGQNLRNPNAEVYIVMASENPDTDNDLSDRGWKFWETARFKFQCWVAMQRLRLNKAKAAR